MKKENSDFRSRKVNKTLEGKRWNDVPEDVQRGPFEEWEVEKLMHSLCQYIQEKSMSSSDLKRIVDENTKLLK